VAKDKQRKKEPAADAGATLATHPRASRDLLRARGWGALAGFALVAWLAWSAGAHPADVAARALVGGVVGLLVGWGCAVAAWRALAVAEIRAAHRAYEEAVLAAQEARERTATPA
jgi:hypothetical protein